MPKRTKFQIALDDIVSFVDPRRWDWRLHLALLLLIVVMLVATLIIGGIPYAILTVGFGMDKDLAGIIVVAGVFVVVTALHWWESIKDRQSMNDDE